MTNKVNAFLIPFRLFSLFLSNDEITHRPTAVRSGFSDVVDRQCRRLMGRTVRRAFGGQDGRTCIGYDRLGRSALHAGRIAAPVRICVARVRPMVGIVRGALFRNIRRADFRANQPLRSQQLPVHSVVRHVGLLFGRSRHFVDDFLRHASLVIQSETVLCGIPQRLQFRYVVPSVVLPRIIGIDSSGSPAHVAVVAVRSVAFSPDPTRNRRCSRRIVARSLCTLLRQLVPRRYVRRTAHRRLERISRRHRLLPFPVRHDPVAVGRRRFSVVEFFAASVRSAPISIP